MAQLDNGELITLIGATARSDRGAFATLYQRTAPKLLAILLRILRSKAAAEDALQDVFLKIWQNASSFSPEAGPPMGWLISIARNRAINILRAGIGGAGRIGGHGFVRQACRSQRWRSANGRPFRIATLLGTLEEPARNCILLAYYEGYSREELARRFDRPVGTIKTWLHRNLAVLKSCLEAAT